MPNFAMLCQDEFQIGKQFSNLQITSRTISKLQLFQDMYRRNSRFGAAALCLVSNSNSTTLLPETREVLQKSGRLSAWAAIRWQYAYVAAGIWQYRGRNDSEAVLMSKLNGLDNLVRGDTDVLLYANEIRWGFLAYLPYPNFTVIWLVEKKYLCDAFLHVHTCIYAGLTWCLHAGDWAWPGP